MTKTENIFNDNTTDFAESETVYTTNAADEAAAKLHKRAVKADVISAVTSVAISAAPMVMDIFRHRKDPTPYKVHGGDIARIAVSAVIPTIKAVDTAAFNGKLQKTISEKTPFTFNDIRNVANLVQLYPSAHVVMKNLMENSMNASSGKPRVEAPVGAKSAMLMNTVNLLTPYVVDKMTNEDLSFTEKVSSFMPIGMIGPWVKRLASSNPKARQIYDVTQAVVNVASVGNKAISGATRSNPNSTLNKTSNQIGGILDAVQDLTGMSHGGYGYNNNYYGGNGWNNGSRWSY